MRCLGALAAAGFVKRSDRGWFMRSRPDGQEQGHASGVAAQRWPHD
jgi:hypothetical protein